MRKCSWRPVAAAYKAGDFLPEHAGSGSASCGVRFHAGLALLAMAVVPAGTLLACVSYLWFAACCMQETHWEQLCQGDGGRCHKCYHGPVPTAIAAPSTALLHSPVRECQPQQRQQGQSHGHQHTRAGHLYCCCTISCRCSCCMLCWEGCQHQHKCIQKTEQQDVHSAC